MSSGTGQPVSGQAQQTMFGAPMPETHHFSTEVKKNAQYRGTLFLTVVMFVSVEYGYGGVRLVVDDLTTQTSVIWLIDCLTAPTSSHNIVPAFLLFFATYAIYLCTCRASTIRYGDVM
jgi:hypothetical protein